ncbi:MAG: TonB-dependent receptor, partial [Bacteroidota bacterium]
MKRRHIIIIIIALQAFIAPIASQETVKDTIKDTVAQAYNIEEFEIVGKKNISEIIPPRRLSGITLQSLNSQSVADAVRYFSGVQVKDYGGIGGLKTINIRSMGTQQMGV